MPKKKSAEHLIEELARAVKRGFDETATRRDLEALAAKQQLQLVADNLDLARADIHDIKLTLGPLWRKRGGNIPNTASYENQGFTKD